MWLVGDFGGKSLDEDWTDGRNRLPLHPNFDWNGSVLFQLHKEPQMRNLSDDEKISYIIIGICLGIGLGFILSMWYLYPPY